MSSDPEAAAWILHRWYLPAGGRWLGALEGREASGPILLASPGAAALGRGGADWAGDSSCGAGGLRLWHPLVEAGLVARGGRASLGPNGHGDAWYPTGKGGEVNLGSHLGSSLSGDGVSLTQDTSPVWRWTRYAFQVDGLGGAAFCLITQRGQAVFRMRDVLGVSPLCFSRQSGTGRVACHWQPMVGGYGALRVRLDGVEVGWLAGDSGASLMPLGSHPVHIQPVLSPRCVWQARSAPGGGGFLLRHPACGGFLQLLSGELRVAASVPITAHWLAGQDAQERFLPAAMTGVPPGGGLTPLRVFGRKRQRVPGQDG